MKDIDEQIYKKMMEKSDLTIDTKKVTIKTKTTNGDKIRNMNNGELAYFLWNKEHKCAFCSKIYEMTEEELKADKCDIRTCHLYIKKWLESEAK